MSRRLPRPAPRATSPGAAVAGDISLIVPAKDAADYLDGMFASLHHQLDDLERLDLIFVDDGSSDHTREILERQARIFPRLRVIRHETARGLADARNAGLEIAASERIAFLDGDDWLRPGHLEVMIRALDELDVDFVRCDHVQVHGDRRAPVRAPMAVRGTRLDPRTGILPAGESTLVDYPFAWAGAFHRRLLDRGLLRFPAGFMTAEDRSWIWGLHLHADSFAVVDAPGICYRRQVAGSLTQLLDARQLWFIDGFERIIADVAADPEASALMPKVIRNWLAILAHHLERSPRMEPSTRAELIRRSRELSASLPRELLLSAFRQQKPARRAVLMRHLPSLGSLPLRLKEVLA